MRSFKSPSTEHQEKKSTQATKTTMAQRKMNWLQTENANEFAQSIPKTRYTVQPKKPRISALSRTHKKAKSPAGFAKNAIKSAFSNSIEHNHVASDDKRRYGLNDVTKAEIAAFYKAGVRKASRLLTALRKEMFLSKK